MSLLIKNRRHAIFEKNKEIINITKQNQNQKNIKIEAQFIYTIQR